MTEMRNAMLAAVLAVTLAAVPAGEAQNEAAFLAIPSSAGASATSRVLDSVYHYAGTPGDHRLAISMRDQLQRDGLRAWIETFHATVYTPRILQLQLLSSPVVTFDLRDMPVPGDRDGHRPGIGLPFNAGSGSGDVRAPLVDAGRGLDADYARLARAGTPVRGRIVLVRYGAEYRGNLAARAQARGAAGVIFFSDPGRNPYARYTVQRGDVMGNDHRPLRIPTLPVTAATAQRLIANAQSAHPSLVRLHVEMNARTATLWNTIGEVTGRNPAQMVVLGGHRDAWVYGVTDDGSGISTLLEVARGLGELHRRGWTPLRSIRIAGWDGEEIGELGSEAYVAAHRAELQRGCVAYINTDESASGPIFGAAAAGAIEPAAARAIDDVLHIAQPQIGVPAGGSDFESFIYGIGTPILDIGYTGNFGTYHSPYDDYHYASTYADPGFVHHRTIAQTVGVLAMRLADESAVPYRFTSYASALNAGMSSLTTAAAAAHLSISPALGYAIARFEGAADAYDSRPHPNGTVSALHAAQRLDMLAYSASGYASVAFPEISNAIATGKQPLVDARVRATVIELGSIANSLKGAE